MFHYIQNQWRGKLGLLKSCIINGVAIPFVIAVGGGFILGFGSSLLGSNAAAVDYIANGIVYLCLLVEVWICVGCFRCGLRHVSDHEREANKVGGVLAILWAVLIAFLLACVTFHLWLHGPYITL